MYYCVCLCTGYNGVPGCDLDYGNNDHHHHNNCDNNYDVPYDISLWVLLVKTDSVHDVCVYVLMYIHIVC